MDSKIEEIAEVIETLDNLIAAMSLPFKPEHHIEGLKGGLPIVRDRLRAAYIALGGENHWEGRPEAQR